MPLSFKQLDVLDDKRRAVIAARSTDELLSALDNWDGLDRLATISDEEWEAVAAGYLSPESFFQEEGIEDEVVIFPGKHWG
jgi:hypothetical protein